MFEFGQVWIDFAVIWKKDGFGKLWSDKFLWNSFLEEVEECVFIVSAHLEHYCFFKVWKRIEDVRHFVQDRLDRRFLWPLFQELKLFFQMCKGWWRNRKLVEFVLQSFRRKLNVIFLLDLRFSLGILLVHLSGYQFLYLFVSWFVVSSYYFYDTLSIYCDAKLRHQLYSLLIARKSSKLARWCYNRLIELPKFIMFFNKTFYRRSISYLI